MSQVFFALEQFLNWHYRRQPICWSPPRALLFNFLSASTFLAGGLAAHASSRLLNVSFLLPCAAGNFIYIAAADLIPEVKHQAGLRRSVLHMAAFGAGVGLMIAARLFFEAGD